MMFSLSLSMNSSCLSVQQELNCDDLIFFSKAASSSILPNLSHETKSHTPNFQVCVPMDNQCSQSCSLQLMTCGCIVANDRKLCSFHLNLICFFHFVLLPILCVGVWSVFGNGIFTLKWWTFGFTSNDFFKTLSSMCSIAFFSIDWFFMKCRVTTLYDLCHFRIVSLSIRWKWRNEKQSSDLSVQCVNIAWRFLHCQCAVLNIKVM